VKLTNYNIATTRVLIALLGAPLSLFIAVNLIVHQYGNGSHEWWLTILEGFIGLGLAALSVLPAYLAVTSLEISNGKLIVNQLFRHTVIDIGPSLSLKLSATETRLQGAIRIATHYSLDVYLPGVYVASVKVHVDELPAVRAAFEPLGAQVQLPS